MAIRWFLCLILTTGLGTLLVLTRSLLIVRIISTRSLLTLIIWTYRQSLSVLRRMLISIFLRFLTRRTQIWLTWCFLIFLWLCVVTFVLVLLFFACFGLFWHTWIDFIVVLHIWVSRVLYVGHRVFLIIVRHVQSDWFLWPVKLPFKFNDNCSSIRYLGSFCIEVKIAVSLFKLFLGIFRCARIEICWKTRGRRAYTLSTFRLRGLVPIFASSAILVTSGTLFFRAARNPEPNKDHWKMIFDNFGVKHNNRKSKFLPDRELR